MISRLSGNRWSYVALVTAFVAVQCVTFSCLGMTAIGQIVLVTLAGILKIAAILLGLTLPEVVRLVK